MPKAAFSAALQPRGLVTTIKSSIKDYIQYLSLNTSTKITGGFLFIYPFHNEFSFICIDIYLFTLDKKPFSYIKSNCSLILFINM